MDAAKTFLSYSRSDSETALALARTLRERGVKLWVDRFDIPPGEPFRAAIDEALESCSTVLVLLSPRSAASPEVEAEWNGALADGKRVVPVLAETVRIPRRLAVLQCTDLSEDDADELERLVRALGGRPANAPAGEVTQNAAAAAVPPHDGPLATSQPPDNVPATAAPDERAPPATAVPTPEQTGARSGPAHGVRRRAGAIAGLIIGALYGTVSTYLVYVDDARNIVLEATAVYGGLAAVLGAIVGAITGMDRRALLPMAATVAAVSIAWVLAWGTYEDVVATGMILGGGSAAVLVAIVRALLTRR